MPGPLPLRLSGLPQVLLDLRGLLLVQLEAVVLANMLLVVLFEGVLHIVLLEAVVLIVLLKGMILGGVLPPSSGGTRCRCPASRHGS